MAHKQKKDRERKTGEEVRNRETNEQQKKQEATNRSKWLGQSGPGAANERGSERASRGKARP